MEKSGTANFVTGRRTAPFIGSIRRSFRSLMKMASHSSTPPSGTRSQSASLAEERIRQQAELLNKTHDAVIVCDLNFRIIYWNKGAESMYGWEAAEVLGRDFRRDTVS